MSKHKAYKVFSKVQKGLKKKTTNKRGFRVNINYISYLMMVQTPLTHLTSVGGETYIQSDIALV
jgi:hypothetical protein